MAPHLWTRTSLHLKAVPKWRASAVDMPLLSTLNLDNAFLKSPAFLAFSRLFFPFLWYIDIGAFSKLPTVPYRMDHVNVKCIRDIESLSSTMTEIVVGCYCCNDRGLTRIDFSCCKQLKSVKVGMASFKYAVNVSFVEMPELESICLDCRSFTRYVPLCYLYCGSGSGSYQSSGNSTPSLQRDSDAFIVRGCSKLNSISIHNKACLNFTKCEIRDNPSLSTIRMDRAVKVLASDESLHGYEPDQAFSREDMHEEAGCFAFRNCRTLTLEGQPLVCWLISRLATTEACYHGKRVLLLLQICYVQEYVKGVGV